MPQPVSSPPPINAPAVTPSLRKLGTGSTDAAAGNDFRFTASNANTAQRVADLRALSAAPPSWSTWKTSGYAAANDGGHGDYDWHPTSTDADDGALTIKITAVATGRFKFRAPLNRLFPLPACGIDGTGATHVGASLTSLAAALYAAGYAGFDGGGRQFNLTASGGGDAAYTLPDRAEGAPWRHYRMRFKGDTPSTSFWASIPAQLKVESGATGAGAVVPSPIIYGSRFWTQTVYAGDDTFNGVSDIRNLVVGDPVLIRLGADPTDAYGTAYTHYIAKIVTITPTSGTAGNIVVDRRVPETPVNPLPAYNINVNRLANKHDLMKIMSWQDNTLFEDCEFNDVLVGSEFARNLVFYRPTSQSSSQSFLFFGCEGIRLFDPAYKSVKGLNTNAGDPTVDPFANYGGFLTLNACRDTVVTNLQIDKFSGSGGICDEELQCRNTHFTGLTRVNFTTGPSPTPRPIDNSFIVTPHGLPSLVVDNFVSEGGGIIPPSAAGRFGRVRLGTQNAASTSYYLPYTQQWPISAGAISESLVFRKKEYRQKKRCSVLCAKIPVNGTTTYPIHVNGIVRECRFYASAVTGITTIKVTGPDIVSPGANAASALVAGQWVNFSDATLLSDGVQNMVSDVQWISITTDGTFSADTYVLVDLEIWQPGVSMDGNYVVTDASSRDSYYVPGAPSANADFLGQEILGDGGTSWYKAMGIGGGAADWLRLGGAPLPATVAATAAPSTPSSGNASVYVDSTSKNICVKDDAGVIKHGVKTKTVTSNQFLTAIADDGTVSAARPAASDVSGLATIATSGSASDLTAGTVPTARLGNSGTTAGRPRVRELISDGSFSGTVFTASWSANKYRDVYLTIQTKTGSAGYCVIALTGCSGTYRGIFEYVNGGGSVAGAGNGWTFPLDAPTVVDAHVIAKNNGAYRAIFFEAYGGGGPFSLKGNGDLNDTTNDATGLTITFAASGTAEILIEGIPV